MTCILNKTAQQYFDIAYEYHVATLTLYMSIFEAPYLYNPTAFLLRHSIELLLKGLIIKETQKSRRIAANKITIGNRKLNQTHSLLSLWNHFKTLYPIPEERIIALNKAIEKLNKKDIGADRYRYPYKKQGQPIPVEPIVFDTSKKAPDLEDGIPYIIETPTDSKVITKGPVLLTEMKTLIEEMEILFSLSEEA